MSRVVDTFFGGAEQRASRSQQRSLQQAQAQIAQQTNVARQEAGRLFEGAQESQRAGFQGALDVFGETIPEQARLFGEGNVAAQQQLIGGLPQIQRALLGQPVDFGGFQPTQLTPDLGFAQQTLPEVAPITETVTPPGTLSAQAQNIHPQAQRVLDAFNRGRLSRAQALNRLQVGNAPGTGNRFPGLPSQLANELLDFQGGQ